MKNLDLNKSRQEVVDDLYKAMAGEDKDQLNNAMTAFADNIRQEVLKEARQDASGQADRTILASRGVHVLTQEENEYYQSIAAAMLDKNPKMALTNVDKVLPKTVIDMVFEDIRTNYPLLGLIDFQSTEAIVEMVMSTHSGTAGWGELCATITDELAGSFEVIQLGQKKLSAWIPVCKAMLELGPQWLDRYVRAILTEAIATGLELAIVDGDGNGKPLGMTRADRRHRRRVPQGRGRCDRF